MTSGNSVEIALDTTIFKIPQDEVCTVCGHPMELTYLDFEVGKTFVVKTYLPGYLCMNCGCHALSERGVSEMFSKSREIMQKRGLSQEVALIDIFIARHEKN